MYIYIYTKNHYYRGFSSWSGVYLHSTQIWSSWSRSKMGFSKMFPLQWGFSRNFRRWGVKNDMPKAGSSGNLAESGIQRIRGAQVIPCGNLSYGKKSAYIYRWFTWIYPQIWCSKTIWTWGDGCFRHSPHPRVLNLFPNYHPHCTRKWWFFVIPTIPRVLLIVISDMICFL